MPDTTHVVLTMLDGKLHDFTTRTFMCAADRHAFEQRFGVSSATLMRESSQLQVLSAAASEEADAQTAAIAQALPPGAGADFRESWMLFFCWRAGAREVPALAELTFDEEPGGFLQTIADYDIDPAEDDAADPTDPAAPPG